ERRPIVCAFPPLAANQRDANANELSSGCERVTAMMPGICLYCCALNVSPNPLCISKQGLFYDNHREQNRERERSGCMAWLQNFADTLNGQTDRGSQHSGRYNRRCNRLRFPVAVGMRSIGRSRCNLQPAPNDERASDVQARFDAVRNENIGVPEHAA